MATPLSEEEKSRLSNCDNSSEYYTSTIQNLKPATTYEVLIRTKYRNENGQDLQLCNEGLCETEYLLVVTGILNLFIKDVSNLSLTNCQKKKLRQHFFQIFIVLHLTTNLNLEPFDQFWLGDH